jgi:peptide/nickel transport system substrate-binding protein
MQSENRISRRFFLRVATVAVGGASLGVLAVTAAPAQLAVAAARTAAADRAPLMTIAAAGDIDTGDPHISQLLIYNNVIRMNVFNSLIRYGPTMDYQPELAESWDTPDDKTYVFHIRKGVAYHDGTPVQASDVEFSFKRIGDKKTVFSSRVANVDTYQVLDPATIKLTLKTPQADFIDGLTWLSIVSPAAEATLDKAPIGSGPFKFGEWIPNDHITLQSNPNYWEPNLTQVDTLTFKVIPEAQVAVTNLQAGTLDGMLDLPTSQAVFFKGSKEVKAIIQPTSSIHIFELMGKNSDPIRQNTRVRQALAYCLDKAAVQKTVFSGEGRPKWSWVPIDNWAYKDEAGYPYDTDKAKALLTEAGFDQGFEFTVIIPSGYSDGEKASTIWQAGLAKVGVKLNLEVQELSVWLNNYINHTYDATWNVFPGFADPNYFVALGLKPHLKDQWQNPEADQLADQANATLDQSMRTDLYGKLQDIFVADLPVMVIQEAPQSSLTRPTVSGWFINSIGQVIVRGASPVT